MLAEVAIESYMVGLGGEPIYCQEIESSQPQRKSVDPPSSDELRRKHRGSKTRTRYNFTVRTIRDFGNFVSSLLTPQKYA